MITQKATVLCIYEILKTYSDEEHILSADKIREKLKAIYDVDMERRAIYRNMEALRSMGIEISSYQENREGYYLMDREFDLSEIRLLCDAVAASDMIKEEDSRAIIKKLIHTQSIFQGRLLQRTVFVKSDKKIFNKQIFYNIDALNVAINQGCKVCIKLLEYGLDQELRERKDSPITISPYATLWAEGNYYVLGKIEGYDCLEHFRIDFIKDVQILERGVELIFGSLNPGLYAKESIFQSGGYKEKFDMDCGMDLWQELVETFGKDVAMIKKEDQKLTVRIYATFSVMKKWTLSHLDDCEVKSPKKFRDEIQRTVMQAYKRYWK